MKTTKKNIIILLLVVVAFILSVYFTTDYFNSDSASSATKIFYADNMNTAQKKIISLFNEIHKGRIEIVPIDLPFTKFATNERKEILARSLRSKTDKLDIFTVDVIWGPRFAKWCYKLDNDLDAKFITKFLPRAIESNKYNGDLISVPLYSDIGLMYFRRDLLLKSGITENEIQKIKKSVTWVEFLKICQTVKDAGYPAYVYAADSFEGMICSFHEHLRDDLIHKIFNGDPVNLDHQEVYAALQFMVDLIHKYHYTPPEVVYFDEEKSKYFALHQNAVFIRGWPGFFLNLENTGEIQNRIKNIDVAPLPHIEGKNHTGVFGGWNLMISKYSKNKKEALEFLKFTSSLQAQKLLYSESGYFPVLEEVYSDQEFIAENPDLLYFLSILQTGKHRPYREDYTKISDIMSYYFHMAITKEISVKEAIKLTSEKINSRQAFIK
jgi:multiple sugar transport system substrate-binding protein